MSASSIGIVTDSTADLPPELVTRYSIAVVPALLAVEGKSYRDGEDMSREEFYRRMPTMQTPPTTAVPSPQIFEEAYASHLDKGASEVLGIIVSSKLSSMFATATSAAEKFAGRVKTFDSQQITLGLGFQVLEGAIAAQAGSSMDEILKVVERARCRVEVLAMINSMEYLRRSGRVSWIQAGVSDVLQIKVLLNLENGEVKSLGRTRTRRNALRQLKDILRSWGSLARLAVVHTGIPDEATVLAQELKDRSDTEPLIVDVTTIIGAHVGPGSMGLAALRK